MGLTVTRGDGQTLPVGGRWVIEVEPTDDDGAPLAVTPTIAVTLPDGNSAAPLFEVFGSGAYRAVHEVASAGRYIGVITAVGAGVANVAIYASPVVDDGGMPDVVAYRDYDEDGGGSWSDAAIQGALDAEAAAQRAACRIDAVYPPDMREALLRRVQCNLARRRLPLAVLQGDAEAGSTRPPGKDPEVRRLEGPYRKLVIG